MADDLMELDIKTRPLTKPTPIQALRLLAYVDADRPSEPTYVPARSGNVFGLGLRPSVIRDGSGKYRVIIPDGGSRDGSRRGVVHVSTIEPRGALCRTVDWGGTPDLVIEVECIGTRGGAEADREFVVTVFA